MNNMKKIEWKKIIKCFVPPIITFLLKGKFLRGNYSSWKDAKKDSVGYDSVVILEKVKKSLLKVKNGEAISERDSVLFDKVEYSWPMVAGLLNASDNKSGELRVLDFGGSLGTTYFQNRLFLQDFKELQWAIVEQEHFVRTGKEFFEDQKLKFYHNIEDCVKEINPNVVVLSSVIQYIEKPFEILDKLMKVGADYIIIDRMPLIGKKDRIVVQRVSSAIYRASYPSWLLNEQNFVSFLTRDYNLLIDFDAIDGVWYMGRLLIKHKGYIFKRKS